MQNSKSHHHHPSKFGHAYLDRRSAMRGDFKIIVVAAVVLAVVSFFTISPQFSHADGSEVVGMRAGKDGGGASSTGSRTETMRLRRELDTALKKIDTLSARLDSVSRSDAVAAKQDSAALAVAPPPPQEGKTLPKEVPKNGQIGGPWDRGQKKQRPDEIAECKGWADGTRDTYLHDADAKKHVMPGGFASQYKQDKCLFDKFFKNKKDGTYLDIASNHYKSISNTYFYDRCLGWDGLCVEPNPAYHAGLRLNRSCAVVPKCISDKVETVDFTFPNNFWEAPLGGVNGGQFKNRRPEDARFVDVTIECDTVASMLTGAGVTHIDYFSIDVEGHERRLLTGIDFSKVTFDVILCESHCGEILKANGYAKIKLKEMGGADKIFLRKDGPYGHMLPEVPLE